MKRSAVFLSILVAGVVLMMLCYITIPAVVLAHGSGIDRYGCHRDNKAVNYHCHHGPCVGKTFPSQEEMLRSPCAR